MVGVIFIYMNMKHRDYYWIILLISCILIIVLPTLITTFHIPLGCLNTDFTNTGQIGDAIGGITAPIIGLISIWLLYITFREQRQFNEKQSEFNNHTLLTNLQEKILEKLDNLTLTYNSHTYIGFDEIYTNKDNLSKIDEQELIKFKSNLIYCHRLIRIFLLTNKEAPLKQGIKGTLYKMIEDIVNKLLEIYDIVKMGQSNTQKTWAEELQEYLDNCNPEK